MRDFTEDVIGEFRWGENILKEGLVANSFI